MSMICDVYAVSSEQAARLAADPTKGVEALTGGDASASAPLEKSWHGLHFLLTGSGELGKPPLNFLLDGGRPVGDDLGYGPARLLNTAETRTIHAALSEISEEKLWERYDAATMNEQSIYPTIWDEPEKELREEYLTYFRELKRLVGTASDGGMSLVIVLG